MQTLMQVPELPDESEMRDEHHHGVHSEWFRNVISVVIGVVAAQFSGFFAARRERKRAISVALSDLLAVRYQLFALDDTVDKISDSVGSIPEQEKSRMHLFLTSLFPKWEELHKRYDDAVTTLAGLDPLLAYELRSKDFILPTVDLLHTALAQDPQAAAQRPMIKTSVLDKFRPVFNRSLVRLARKKSPICWYRTWQLVKRKNLVPEEMKEFLAVMKDAIEAGKKAVEAPANTQEAGSAQSATAPK